MATVTGGFVTKDGEQYYRIENAHLLKPFFINVATDSDIWMFLSSRGGLTAGRRNSSGAIFPYETDDKLHAQSETGPKTVIKINDRLWEPFEKCNIRRYDISRHIYKGIYGNSIIFEEENRDLGLTFWYKWISSERYGIVRTSCIENHSGSKVTLEILDGVQNVLPYGVNTGLQESASCLVDAYKACELDTESSIGIFSQTTLVNDSPNPIEMMYANVIWTTLKPKALLLSSDQVQNFCDGGEVVAEERNYGSRAAYLMVHELHIGAGEQSTWHTVLDIGYNQARIAELSRFVQSIQGGDVNALLDDILRSQNSLKRIVAMSDGLQETADELAKHHHYLNVLYNVMRGGVFIDGYSFDYDDFREFVAVRNKSALNNTALLERVAACKTVGELKACAKADADLYRLSLEYMPLSFSRRHGDPSRPWNRFNIEVKNEKGERISSYEGNWRDIFQNWEALSISYPCYLENMIAKFVNASTIDGFNPYRINKAGIDWEKVEEDNPFSGFGYWGDHQVIYLLKLLAQLQAHFPKRLTELLTSEVFAYANVPYEILPYDHILKDSKNTIRFNFEKDRDIEKVVETFGTDAKLLLQDGRVYHVTMLEKLIVPVLSKLSNLVVGGGIWMNTQRPEWNDANNAIVGIGLSMVTVYNLYQYLRFMKELLQHEIAECPDIEISTEILVWMNGIAAILDKNKNDMTAAKSILDELGYCFGAYRDKVYKNGFSGKTKVAIKDFNNLIDLGLYYLDYTITHNKSELFSSYNLLKSDWSVEPMRPMLEGQSSVIASGYLNADEVTGLLNSMTQSGLYAERMGSYYLYPVKLTERFMDKNILHTDNPIEPDGDIVLRDTDGKLRFGSAYATEGKLRDALAHSSYSEAERELLLSLYEDTFGQRRFTGRSEVMYRFEGIGCIYWHQNAKLLLGVQDMLVREYLANGPSDAAKKLKDEYLRLTQGMLYRKDVALLGAFPIEPYSHSSYIGKAEQPGMTGQVKESVLARRRELGVIVKDGSITFHPFFIRDEEFMADGSISFTICEIPVSYQRCEAERIIVTMADGREVTIEQEGVLELPQDISMSVFERKTEGADGIKSIKVCMK